MNLDILLFLRALSLSLSVLSLRLLPSSRYKFPEKKISCISPVRSGFHISTGGVESAESKELRRCDDVM